MPSLQACIDLLIGNTVPEATAPWEVINSVNDGPYRSYSFGWSINGVLRNSTDSDDQSQAVSCRVQVTSRLEDQLQKLLSYFALQCLKGRKKRFQSNNVFQEKYINFTDDLFVKGHVSQVLNEDLSREDGTVAVFAPPLSHSHPQKQIKGCV